MERVWENLIQSWQLHGLPLQKPCKEEGVRLFESSYGVTLPPDFREYLLKVNGMRPVWPGDQDEEGFTFWPLERMKTLAEEVEARDQDSWKVAEQNSYFLFCDYLIWCWAYAVKIDRLASRAKGIYLLCCNDPIKIADSFSEFVQLYLEKSPTLYPPTTHQHV